MNKPNTNTKEYLKIEKFEVTGAKVLTHNDKQNVLFNLTLNGVTIYGCRVVEYKDGDFIAFPARKGNDGKYYNIANAYISPEDTKSILSVVEKQINS